ncbi:MAG TPA: pilin [Nevskiaceae bacterium]
MGAALLGLVSVGMTPGCQGHLVRAQAAEGFSLVETATNAVTEYYVERGALPDDNAEVGLPPRGADTGRYVNAVRVLSGGRVEATFDTPDTQLALRTQTLVMEPEISSGSITWKCSGTLAPQNLPAACAARATN